MNGTPNSVAIEIKEIFETQKLDDLKSMMARRRCLNTTNNVLIYLYHLVQSAGILTSSVAAGFNNQTLIWVGISLNIFASLIHVYEKTNNSIMRRLLYDIKSIKDGNYVAESELVDVDKHDSVESPRYNPKFRSVERPTFRPGHRAEETNPQN